MKHFRKILVGVLFAVGFGSIVYAGTFNLFSPATGVLKGNASTYVTTAAASSDIIGMWTGTCNSSTFLAGDGTCQSAGGGGGTPANPTGTVGLSVVNGSASTYMRSDAAPPLSQAITPTWSGVHIFSAQVKVANGSVGAPSIAFTNSTDTGLYRRGSKRMGIVAGGSELIDLDASGGAGNEVAGIFAPFIALGTEGVTQNIQTFGDLDNFFTQQFEISSSYNSLTVPVYVHTSGFTTVTDELSLLSASADNKNWRTTLTGSTYSIAAWADLYGSHNDFLTVTRSGTTISTANVQATTVQVNGQNVRDAAILTSGTVATARLGSGTANSTTFLRGDQTWQAVSVASIPNAAFGRFTVSGACAVAGSSGSGISSCSYTSTGFSTVNFTATSSGGWVCSANSAANTTARAIRVSGASTTSVNILTYDLTGTLVDTDFTLTCMGT